MLGHVFVLKQSKEIEKKRSSLINEEVRRVVDRLIDIGYALPDDVERLIEPEVISGTV